MGTEVGTERSRRDVEAGRNPHHYCIGGVAERLNAAVLKTAEAARLPWVRIPPPPRLFRPQLTAFFTSAPIFASAAAVNSFSAKATGHAPPSSRFAASLKPNVAYLLLNFCASWKKQTTLPSL